MPPRRPERGKRLEHAAEGAPALRSYLTYCGGGAQAVARRWRNGQVGFRRYEHCDASRTSDSNGKKVSGSGFGPGCSVVGEEPSAAACGGAVEVECCRAAARSPGS